MGLPAIAEHQTVAFTGSWLAGQLSGNTKRAYTADIRQFLGFLGHDNLLAVRREDLYDYRGWLAQTFAPATVNRKLTSIRMLLQEAVRHGVIEYSPAEGLKGHRSEGNYSTTKAPSREQVHRLLDACEGDSLIDVRDKAMLWTLIAMGLRRSELVGMTPADIAEDGGQMVLEVRGKGNKRRKLVWHPEALAAVRKWLDVSGIRGDRAIFQAITNNGGTHIDGLLTPGGVYYIAKRRMEQVGIEGCSPHSFRHYRITRLLEQGCSIYEAQKLAGHSDPRTTERYDRSNAVAQAAARYDI